MGGGHFSFQKGTFSPERTGHTPSPPHPTPDPAEHSTRLEGPVGTHRGGGGSRRNSRPFTVLFSSAETRRRIAAPTFIYN